MPTIRTPVAAATRALVDSNKCFTQSTLLLGTPLTEGEGCSSGDTRCELRKSSLVRLMNPVVEDE